MPFTSHPPSDWLTTSAVSLKVMLLVSAATTACVPLHAEQLPQSESTLDEGAVVPSVTLRSPLQLLVMLLFVHLISSCTVPVASQLNDDQSPAAQSTSLIQSAYARSAAVLLPPAVILLIDPVCPEIQVSPEHVPPSVGVPKL